MRSFQEILNNASLLVLPRGLGLVDAYTMVLNKKEADKESPTSLPILKKKRF
jgi:hypothetical protein